MEEMHGHCEKVPGEDISLKTQVLNVGANMLQEFGPIKNICEHVCGLHFYSGDLKRTVVAHHYCSCLNEDFRQCLIYDSDKKDAKLIGVEYIISEKIYKTLPDDEAKYWHSHVYEVKGGLITCPQIPEIVEREVMKILIKTYGKTIHLWQIDRGDTIPLGPPQVMMAFTKDEQVPWHMVQKRDELYGGSYEELRKTRAEIPEPVLDPRADGWEKTGKAVQLEVKEFDMPK